MLTNPQRVRPEDKPLADLALKTAEKCKAAAMTVWAMLPPPVHAKVLRVTRQLDALNTELYAGKNYVRGVQRQTDRTFKTDSVGLRQYLGGSY